MDDDSVYEVDEVQVLDPEVVVAVELQERVEQVPEEEVDSLVGQGQAVEKHIGE